MLLVRRLLLGLALILATVGLTGYLHRLRDTVPVVVAAVDIPANTPLTPDQLTIRQVNREAAATLTSTALHTTAEAAGLVTRMGVPAGEVIRREPWLVSVAPAGADAALPRYHIPANLRLVGVRTDQPGAAAGRLSPGDRVDVIYTSKGNQTGGIYARTILQAVEVYALGARTSSTVTPSAASEVDVTLLVTPEQAQILALAKRSGGAIDLSVTPPAPLSPHLTPTLPADLQGGPQPEVSREEAAW